MQWCKIVGFELYIVLNMGIGEFVRFWVVDYVLIVNQEFLMKVSVFVERVVMWVSRLFELIMYIVFVWFEYCNFIQDIYYVNLRCKNGYEELYNVGVFEVFWSFFND